MPDLNTDYDRLYAFIQWADRWLAQPNLKETRFNYAVGRNKQRADKVFADFQDQCTAIDVKLCAVDDREVILRDERGQLRFTKENEEKRTAERKALAAKTFTFDAYHAKPPKALPFAYRSAFAGFVFAEMSDEDAALLPEEE